MRSYSTSKLIANIDMHTKLHVPLSETKSKQREHRGGSKLDFAFSFAGSLPVRSSAFSQGVDAMVGLQQSRTLVHFAPQAQN